MPTRRSFLASLAAAGLTGAALPAPADPPREVAGVQAAAAVVAGRQFLAGLFDPDLGLLPEFRGSGTFWLFHDNYLAAKALRPADPAPADRIAASVAGFGVRESGKIEILFGEAARPLPFRHHRLDEVRRVGEKVVKTEAVTDRPFAGWEEYADLLLLAAVAQAQPDRPAARQSFAAAEAMWDGVGLADRVTAATGLYATYKLALALLAARAVEAAFPAGPAVRDRLLAMQAADGGWVTDYDRSRKPAGVANVETTSLAVLALDAAARPNRPEGGA